MRKIIIFLVIFSCLFISANAAEFTAPPAPETVQRYMPDETNNFAEGVHYVLRNALETLWPSVFEAAGNCISLVAVALITSVSRNFPFTSKRVMVLSQIAASTVIVMRPTNTLIQMGADTVQQISEYGKMLLPVMCGALAAQGGVTKSSAIYAATNFFNTVLSAAIADLLIPLVYIFVCVCVGSHIIEGSILSNISALIKWLTIWGLKTLLYVFTGYIAITGAVSGATDAAMLKATKLTISGMVPVVGNILSDASEAVLTGAALMKNTAGVYGLISMIAITVVPFARVGIQYIMLNLTSGACNMLGSKEAGTLVKDFSVAMGLLLAMIGTVSVLMVISIVCFMKGVV